MKKKINKQQLITGGAIIILIISLLMSALIVKKNKSLDRNLRSEMLKSELMLSEKLLLEKEIANFRKQITLLNGTNSELNKMLAEISDKLSQKEGQLKKITRDNSNIANIKKELTEVSKMRKDLESQVQSLNAKIDKLNQDKDGFNSTIAALRAENERLNEDLQLLSSITADNFLVETTRGKNKLTVKARRTNKIAVSFKVPSNQSENLNFKITKPDGKQVNGNDKAIATRIVKDEEMLLASNKNGEIKVSKKIEMTYQPNEKLKPGVYVIEIFNGERYVGSSNVRLR